MDQIVSSQEHSGLLDVFINIGLEQLSLPVPDHPMWILTGALRFDGHGFLLVCY